MAARERETQTEQKHKDLFQAYMDVIKKHGEYAKTMRKRDLYQETVESAAPSFYMTWQKAGRVIQQQMSKKKVVG